MSKRDELIVKYELDFKDKNQQLTKIGIMMLGISLLFLVSCETNSETINTKQEQGFSIKEVSFTEFNTNSKLIEKISSIERISKNIASIASRTNSPEEVYDIDTSHAIYIESGNGTHHTYTFAVNVQDEVSELENIVLSLQENGSYKAYLTTYNLTEEQLSDLNNGSELNVSEDNSSVVEIGYDQVNFMSRIGCTYEFTTMEIEHACTLDGCWDPQYTTIEYINVWVEVCSGGGGGGSGNGSGSGGGGGTGSGSSNTIPTKPVGIQNNEDPCSPAPVGDLNGNCMLEYFEACLGNINSSVLSSFNSEDIEALGSYINSQGNCDDSTQAFILFASDALQEEFYESTIEDLLEILDFEQDYRNQMSQAERTIFDGLNRKTQLQYLQSAYNATVMSEDLYPNTITNPCNLYNGIGDAYRHALWNALSTVRIGGPLTEQLTNAHEDRPAPTGYADYLKEKQMDLYNNARGRELAYGSGLVWEMVKTSLENGEFRYLSPLNIPTNCRATSSSLLTQTN